MLCVNRHNGCALPLEVLERSAGQQVLAGRELVKRQVACPGVDIDLRGRCAVERCRQVLDPPIVSHPSTSFSRTSSATRVAIVALANGTVAHSVRVVLDGRGRYRHARAYRWTSSGSHPGSRTG